ncbi:DUF2852 domain-containing protein [Microvirga arsenatis]|uniref:DUF2852 domain-containing protein n=1 Tax=Microvirga arsenatis TaxID=2692265 RepID=A0ABW9YVW5_9HYPH|nr:DUF2852 domain-containing protein [Microvirga arsenatis]NBJ10599.1 DUF2852 domain-containing protein [Microvirga arsenatis]NBJ24502.1 DUF2852 domain-containing protein [Microvirga arsenatis]
MSDSASAAWNAGPHVGPWENRTDCRRGRKPGRGLEIAGIILGFIFVWPLALAYLVWKMCGYPKYDEAKAFLNETFGRAKDDLFRSRGPAGFGGFASTGNAAFDEYRRSELERLEEERRRLDEEARDFRNFVEELKRAKDREEFDAYMAKRRGNGPTNV